MLYSSQSTFIKEKEQKKKRKKRNSTERNALGVSSGSDIVKSADSAQLYSLPGLFHSFLRTQDSSLAAYTLAIH